MKLGGDWDFIRTRQLRSAIAAKALSIQIICLAFRTLYRHKFPGIRETKILSILY